MGASERLLEAVQNAAPHTDASQKAEDSFWDVVQQHSASLFVCLDEIIKKLPPTITVETSQDTSTYPVELSLTFSGPQSEFLSVSITPGYSIAIDCNGHDHPPFLKDRDAIESIYAAVTHLGWIDSKDLPKPEPRGLRGFVRDVSTLAWSVLAPG